MVSKVAVGGMRRILYALSDSKREEGGGSWSEMNGEGEGNSMMGMASPFWVLLLTGAALVVGSGNQSRRICFWKRKPLGPLNFLGVGPVTDTGTGVGIMTGGRIARRRGSSSSKSE